jgi:hypothetical protein
MLRNFMEGLKYDIYQERRMSCTFNLVAHRFDSRVLPSVFHDWIIHLLSLWSSSILRGRVSQSPFLIASSLQSSRIFFFALVAHGLET